MKTKTILLFLLSLVLASSCVKDDTSSLTYGYNDYSIEGIEPSYTRLVNSPLEIQTTIKIAHIKDESELDYYWVMTSPANTKVLDTVSRKKDLSMNTPGKYGETISCALYVVDRKRDIRYVKSTSIRITSNYKTGWVLLSEKENNGYLSFISDATKSVYHDLYGTIFNEPMPKAKSIHFKGMGASDSSVGVVLEKESAEKSFFLEGKNFTYFTSLEKLFKTLDYVEGPFKPENISLDPTCQMFGVMYILSNKKIYAKPGSSTIDSNFFGAPVGGDYEVGELYGTTGNSGETFITYDYKNKRYIYTVSDDLLNVRSYSTPAQASFSFDMSNVDVTPLWMGTSSPVYFSSSSYFVSIVKNNTTQAYQLHLIDIVRQKVDNIWGYYPIRVAHKDLPSNIYNPSCQICASANVLYIANDKTIYRMNLELFGNIEPIVTMDERITCLEFASNSSLIVGTDSGKTEFPGNIRIVSTSTENLGEILSKYDGVGGIIKDVVYKPQ